MIPAYLSAVAHNIARATYRYTHHELQDTRRAVRLLCTIIIVCTLVVVCTTAGVVCESVVGFREVAVCECRGFPGGRQKIKSMCYSTAAVWLLLLCCVLVPPLSSAVV